MSEQEIPTFPKAHDPDNTSARNFDIGWMLRRLNGAFDSAQVLVGAGESVVPVPATEPAFVADPLVISLVSYDATAQRVSFRISGGTPGARYLITLRVFLTDGRSEDASAWQLVRQR